MVVKEVSLKICPEFFHIISRYAEGMSFHELQSHHMPMYYESRLTTDTYGSHSMRGYRIVGNYTCDVAVHSQ